MIFCFRYLGFSCTCSSLIREASFINDFNFLFSSIRFKFSFLSFVISELVEGLALLSLSISSRSLFCRLRSTPLLFVWSDFPALSKLFSLLLFRPPTPLNWSNCDTLCLFSSWKGLTTLLFLWIPDEFLDPNLFSSLNRPSSNSYFLFLSLRVLISNSLIKS